MPRTAVPKALLKFNFAQLSAALNSKRADRLVELKGELREVEARRSALIAELSDLGESVSLSPTGRRGRKPGRKPGPKPGRAGGRGRARGRDSIASRALLHLSDKGEDSVQGILGKLGLKEEQRAGLSVALSNLKSKKLLESGSERGRWKITASGKDAVKRIPTSD